MRRRADCSSVTTADQWDRNREGYELFRRLWDSDRVTWPARFRPPLVDAKALPRPFQKKIRIWHGSATSKDSVDLAAQHGDPIFSANVTHPIEPYAELVRHYRQRWAFYGRDPDDVVGAGTAGFTSPPRRSEAIDAVPAAFEIAFGVPAPARSPVYSESIEASLRAARR